MKKPLSREAIRAIAIRRKIAKQKAQSDQGTLPGIVAETPVQPKGMHPRLLAMCLEAGGFEQDRYNDAA